MKTRRNILIEDAQWLRLKALSEKTLAPISALVRKAIEEFLRKAKA
jgi:predicted DNA-binding protein